LVEVGDCVGLIANEVIEAVGGGRVDEGVANPETGSDAVKKLVKLFMMGFRHSRLINVCNCLESSFNTILLNLTRLKSGHEVFS